MGKFWYTIDMTNIHTIARSSFAIFLTFAVTFSTGLTLGNVLVDESIEGESLGALLLRSASSAVSKSSVSSKRVVKKKLKTVKRSTIVRPSTRRGTGSSLNSKTSTASSAKAAIKAACGDGLLIRDLGETCDDANIVAGDGCSATCTVEAGFSCAGSPTLCTSRCGDGIVVGKETCDDANNDGGDGCAANCKRELGYKCTGTPSTCELTPYCGDGIKASTEGCDDGNSTPGDGCTATCTVES